MHFQGHTINILTNLTKEQNMIVLCEIWSVTDGLKMSVTIIDGLELWTCQSQKWNNQCQIFNTHHKRYPMSTVFNYVEIIVLIWTISVQWLRIRMLRIHNQTRAAKLLQRERTRKQSPSGRWRKWFDIWRLLFVGYNIHYCVVNNYSGM